jgi:hypothetical protein
MMIVETKNPSTARVLISRILLRRTRKNEAAQSTHTSTVHGAKTLGGFALPAPRHQLLNRFFRRLPVVQDRVHLLSNGHL